MTIMHCIGQKIIRLLAHFAIENDPLLRYHNQPQTVIKLLHVCRMSIK